MERKKEGTTHPKGPGQEERRAGSWTQAILDGVHAQGEQGEGSGFGWVQSQGRSCQPSFSPFLWASVLISQLSHSLRGARSSSGWFVGHQAPLLPNTLSLVPVRRRKLPTESAHSLQGLVSRNNLNSTHNNQHLRGTLCGKLGHLAPFLPSRLPSLIVLEHNSLLL